MKNFFNLALCAILLATMISSSLSKSPSFLQVDQLTSEQVKQICPIPDLTPDETVNAALVNCKAKELNERALCMKKFLKNNVLAISSAQVVRILTTVKYEDGLKKMLEYIDPKVFRITPEDMVTILKVQDKKHRMMVLRELKDTLSDTSDASIQKIIGAFKCKKKPEAALQGVKERNCVLGKLCQKNVIVIDLSGSMSRKFNSNGIKSIKRVEYIKGLMKQFIENMKPDQFFDILIFNYGVAQWQGKLVPANEENKTNAQAFVEKLKARGGTNIIDSAAKALQYVDDSYCVLYNTDGYPTVKERRTDRIVAYVKKINEARVKAGKKAIRINVNLIILGGNESKTTRAKAKECAAQLAETTGGFFKDFHV